MVSQSGGDEDVEGVSMVTGVPHLLVRFVKDHPCIRRVRLIIRGNFTVFHSLVTLQMLHDEHNKGMKTNTKERRTISTAAFLPLSCLNSHVFMKVKHVVTSVTSVTATNPSLVTTPLPYWPADADAPPSGRPGPW